MSAILTRSRLETIGEWMAREGVLVHPQKGRIPFIARPYQRAFWNDTSQLRIICKARQIGFSQAVSAEALRRAMERTSLILIVSRNEDQAIQVLNYAKITYHNLRTAPVLLIGENTRQMEFSNGSKILSLPASPSTGRGFAASHIYIDEAAFVRWAETIYRAIAPAVSSGGTITILSSPDGTENLFGRIYMGGQRGRGPVRDFDGTAAPPGVWSRHHVDWSQNPEYNNPTWIAANHPDHTPKGESPKFTPEEWASEYEASLITSGDRVFRVEKLDEMIEGWIGLDYTDGEPVTGDLWYMPPLHDHLYMSAWDLGRKHDPTVGITLDVTTETHQLVCYERFHNMPWDEQEERIVARYHHYPGWHAIDATGLGDPVHQGLVQAGYDIIPYVFSRVTKPNAVNELKRSTEFGALKQGLVQIYDEMFRYQFKDENIEQDSVMALAIAEFLSRHLDMEEQMAMDDRVEDVSRAFGEW